MDMQYAGIQAFQYQRGFLHQKVVLVDNDRAYVGTANFDNRSFHLNFEITVMVRDEAFAQEVEAMLLDDFNGCRPLTVESLEKRSLNIPFADEIGKIVLANPIDRYKIGYDSPPYIAVEKHYDADCRTPGRNVPLYL